MRKMTESEKWGISGVRRYRYRMLLFIAILCTTFDFVVETLYNISSPSAPKYSLLLREVVVFVMSLGMGYLFMFTLRKAFRKFPMWLNFLMKTLVVLSAALMMNFLVHVLEYIFIDGLSLNDALRSFSQQLFNLQTLLRGTFYWLALLVITQLFIEINEKFSPGVFADIMVGKYFHPKVENRIVMFIDLKDSTPIAEKLGHE